MTYKVPSNYFSIDEVNMQKAMRGEHFEHFGTTLTGFTDLVRAHLQQAGKEKTPTEVMALVDSYVGSEEFLDTLIKRINKKQLKGKQ
jgi:hypothetical protein